MRTFIAIDVPTNEVMDEFCSQWSGHMRFRHFKWVPPANRHITLHYLGATSPGQLEMLKQSLTTLADFPAFSSQLQGLGVFPDKQNPRVLWAGVALNPQLECLYRQLLELVVTCGFTPEKHDYHPHVTLARMGSGCGDVISELLDGHKTVVWTEIAVRQVTLFESVSSPVGVQYLPLFHVDLSD